MNGTIAARRLAGDRVVVCDVALFYAERSGGIRTYLNEKARYARESGAFEHHLVIPGRRERHVAGHHELRSLQLAASNGYRLPLGTVRETLRAIRPDIVILHDPFWRPHSVTREAHRLGATVVAVHHASPALHAAGIPGPDALYLPALRRIYQHAYEHVDAVMSTVDPWPDLGPARAPLFARSVRARSAAMKLRFGLDPAFRPGPAVPGDGLLFVGRVSLEKRIVDILDAMALADWGRPLRIVGNGPARPLIEARARRLGLGDLIEMRPFVTDRRALARLYRQAACVVAPGPHETFGLAVLEAAASGARVVACSSTPAATLAGPLVHTFTSKDPGDLARAVDQALAAPPDLAAASALAAGLRWERVFEAELRELERLCR
ncbi:MAG TPA: glycosyltransferase [Solirubrobacteraceae bacterium]|nr:glycosyltransferase [Solirubrobacteraceae bacterium]